MLICSLLVQVFTTTKDKPEEAGESSNGEKMTAAKDLLKARKCHHCERHANATDNSLQRYGSAYLITSISLSLVSFSLCYALISSGVDVASLLEKARRLAPLRRHSSS